ncbi:MAG TPA: lipopolysaccharide heptosyltransferase II [Bryobacteraceae bacterium]|nr:lipopolysaccharide heptosyltransferase II [Bryobacteraceae bacterium]
MKILVRATNWVGDAVMSLPALRAVRSRYPDAHITVLARPWVLDLYARERFADDIVPFACRNLSDKLSLSRSLRSRRFDSAILFQNAFEAAAIAFAARIPERIGYARDGRSLLLTRPVPVPQKGDIPEHERFYYLELLRRASILDALPSEDEPIRLLGVEETRADGLRMLGGPAIGISPGAAFGGAKRWYPDRFADAAVQVAGFAGLPVAVFGSAAERPICEQVCAAVIARGITAHNYAGETTLAQFISMAAACNVFLTNDSGPMHIASALGIPTVAVFGATDHRATGPTGPLARVVCHPVECSPCKLRECPIDHRCMTAITSGEVAETAFKLLK